LRRYLLRLNRLTEPIHDELWAASNDQRSDYNAADNNPNPQIREKIEKAKSHNKHDWHSHNPALVIVAELGMTMRATKDATPNLLHDDV